MTNISGIFSISSNRTPQWISLCGHLEAIIKNYFLLQAGNPEAYWYAIYYDSTIDSHNECVEITDKNLVGYVYCEHILPAFWIDDDFLNNEKLEFDYEKFELIDAGVKYLNPKHFSVKNFVMYCRFDKK